MPDSRRYWIVARSTRPKIEHRVVPTEDPAGGRLTDDDDRSNPARPGRALRRCRVGLGAFRGPRNGGAVNGPPGGGVGGDRQPVPDGACPRRCLAIALALRVIGTGRRWLAAAGIAFSRRGAGVPRQTLYLLAFTGEPLLGDAASVRGRAGDDRGLAVGRGGGPPAWRHAPTVRGEALTASPRRSRPRTRRRPPPVPTVPGATIEVVQGFHDPRRLLAIERVEDRLGDPAGRDEIVLAQAGEMLGQGRLAQPHDLLQLGRPSAPPAPDGTG